MEVKSCRGYSSRAMAALSVAYFHSYIALRARFRKPRRCRPPGARDGVLRACRLHRAPSRYPRPCDRDGGAGDSRLVFRKPVALPSDIDNTGGISCRHCDVSASCAHQIPWRRGEFARRKVASRLISLAYRPSTGSAITLQTQSPREPFSQPKFHPLRCPATDTGA